MPSLPHPNPEQGVFETMLVVEGRPVELDAHMTRLAASLKVLFGGTLPMGVRDEILSEASNVSLGRLRLAVKPLTLPLHRGTLASRGLSHAIAVANVDRADVFPSWERGVALSGVPAPDWAGNHKWADRSGLERLEALLGDTAPLLLGEDDAALETSRANVFAAFGEVLRTPAADGRILPGIARAGAIAAAREAGIEVVEDPLPREELLMADEVFLTGSVRGVEPARSLDDAPLPAAGKLSRRVGDDLWRRWTAPLAASGAPTPAAAPPPGPLAR